MEPDTQEGTTRLLQRWLSLSADDQARLAARAEPVFSEHFDMHRNAGRILQLFQGLAPKPAGHHVPAAREVH